MSYEKDQEKPINGLVFRDEGGSKFSFSIGVEAS